MINVKFVTPDGLYKEVESKTVSCLTTDGWRCILENHMPTVLMLEISRFETVESGKKQMYAISGGMVYFEDNNATVLVSQIEHQNEIDIERAKASKDRAEKRIAKNKENLDLKRAQIALAKAINRIDVASYK